MHFTHRLKVLNPIKSGDYILVELVALINMDQLLRYRTPKTNFIFETLSSFNADVSNDRILFFI